jgi:glycosyltransferase involved in cell wall biosynthesis
MGLAHDFDTVLAAAERLQNRAEIVFAFIGGGPRRRETERAATARSLKNVEFHSAVPRPALGDSLAAGDIHLVTLRPEMPGLLVPSKIYGILAAGRPSLYVGPSMGEVHDIVVSAHCGKAISNGDVEALASSIAGYAEDPALGAREGLAARSLFEERFTKAKQTRAFLLQLEAVGKAGPAGRETS